MTSEPPAHRRLEQPAATTWKEPPEDFQEDSAMPRFRKISQRCGKHTEKVIFRNDLI